MAESKREPVPAHAFVTPNSDYCAACGMDREAHEFAPHPEGVEREDALSERDKDPAMLAMFCDSLRRNPEFRGTSGLYLEEIARILRAPARQTQPESVERIAAFEKNAAEALEWLYELDHVDGLDEPYAGAGYCSCTNCQRYAPVIHEAVEIVRALTHQTQEQERALYYRRCGWCGAYEGTVDPDEPCRDATDPATGEIMGPHQFGVYEPARSRAVRTVKLAALPQPTEEE